MEFQQKKKDFSEMKYFLTIKSLLKSNRPFSKVPTIPKIITSQYGKNRRPQALHTLFCEGTQFNRSKSL